MGGGLIQLVAYGSQDMYLTGNPQITFFKIVYRRHTNFSIESIKQTFQGNPDFGKTITSTIQKNGDLIHKCYLQVQIPKIKLEKGGTGTSTTTSKKGFRWLNWLGHVLIKYFEIEIGGQRIDKQTGEWLHLWNELSCPPGKASGYAEMVGNVPKLTQTYFNYTNGGNDTNPYDTDVEVDGYTLYIPMQFWFCRNAGLALPIIALQYHDVNINIEFRELNECIWAVEIKNDNRGDAEENPFQIVSYGANAVKTGDSGQNNISINNKNTNLYVDYIFLDTDERRRFAQVAHEYLIEQVQHRGHQTIKSTTDDNQEFAIKLNFTHPVKELVWVVQPSNFIQKDYSQSRGGRQYYNYTDLWDYSGFTGTPEPKNGGGMPGGRQPHNNSFGLSEVLVEGRLDSTNQWANNLLAISTTTAGYIDISQYTKPQTVSTYSNRYGMWSHSGNNRVDSGDNPVSLAKLVLNGNDRFAERNGGYFNLVQPYQHHTSIPAPGINVYSFALNPEDHQPSGTCNFSRIDNAFLNLTLTSNALSKYGNSGTTDGFNSGSVSVRIYATNYNILRIMSGLGGLAYSN